jgi:hypothetical protein
MSENRIFVLMYHRHKLLNLALSRVRGLRVTYKTGFELDDWIY